jgi:glycerate 2-kinase
MNPLTDPRGFLQALYACAVLRALPAHTLAAHLPPPPAHPGRTVVLGAGKASAAMAEALEAAWPRAAALSGLVVTRYHHVPPGYVAMQASGLARIEVREAAHPVPDAAGLAAAARIAELAQGLSEHDLVIALISGGGSSLLTLPAPGLALAELQAINRALLASGAAIDEMNCVRKHLSAIQGGRLAALCARRPFTPCSSATCQAMTRPSSPAAPRCPMPAPARWPWPFASATALPCLLLRGRASKRGRLSHPSPVTRVLPAAAWP